MSFDPYGKTISLEDYKARKRQESFGTDGSGGDGTNMLESRVARLESDVSHIKADITEIKADIRGMRKDMSTDFRLLFACLIAVALGLAGLMAKGFHWL